MLIYNTLQEPLMGLCGNLYESGTVLEFLGNQKDFLSELAENEWRKGRKCFLRKALAILKTNISILNLQL
jgi:hypothetical protein